MSNFKYNGSLIPSGYLLNLPAPLDTRTIVQLWDDKTLSGIEGTHVYMGAVIYSASEDKQMRCLVTPKDIYPAISIAKYTALDCVWRDEDQLTWDDLTLDKTIPDQLKPLHNKLQELGKNLSVEELKRFKSRIDNIFESSLSDVSTSKYFLSIVNLDFDVDDLNIESFIQLIGESQAAVDGSKGSSTPYKWIEVEDSNKKIIYLVPTADSQTITITRYDEDDNEYEITYSLEIKTIDNFTFKYLWFDLPNEYSFIEFNYS